MEALVIITITFAILCFILINRMKKKEPPKSTSDLEDYYMDMATPTTKLTPSEFDRITKESLERNEYTVHQLSDVLTQATPHRIPEYDKAPIIKGRQYRCVMEYTPVDLLDMIKAYQSKTIDPDIETMLLLELEYRKSEGLYEEETEEAN